MPKRIVRWLHGKVQSHYQSKYHGKYKRPKHVFTFDIFLVGAVVFLAGFILYFNFFWTPGILRQVELSVVAPSEIRVGELVEFEISYANRSKSELGGAVLGFEFPRNFILESSEPMLDKFGTLHPGTIPPRGGGKVALGGRVIGNLGERQELKAYLTFEEAGTRKEKEAMKTILLAKPAFEVSFDVSSSIARGYELGLPVAMIDISKIPGAEAALQISGGENFFWNKGGSFSGKELESDVWQGYVLPDAKDLRFSVKSTLMLDGGEFINEEKNYPVSLSDPDISVSLLSDKSEIVPGEEISLTLKAINRFQKTINASFGLRDIGSFLDHDFALAGAAWNGDILKFSGTRELNPAGVSEINFKVRAKSDFSDFAGQLKKNPALVIAPFVGYGGDSLFFGNHVELKFATEAGLKTFARYFGPDGDPLGRGPLPPAVGSETRVWIFMSVSNTFNDIAGAVVAAHLADGVEFTGATTVSYGDKIEYDAGTREVSWPLGLVSAYAGAGMEAPVAGFEVKFTPRESDRGQLFTLLDGASVSGQDDYTGKPVRVASPLLKTTFEFDEEAAGRGIVK